MVFDDIDSVAQDYSIDVQIKEFYIYTVNNCC